MRKDDRVSSEEHASVIAGVRQSVAMMRSTLSAIERDLGRLEHTTPVRATPARPARYYEVLVAIYEHGRHGIGTDELKLVAADRGYDRRGMNGFLSGARAALRQDGDRIVLSPEGERLVAEYLGREER